MKGFKLQETTCKY